MGFRLKFSTLETYKRVVFQKRKYIFGLLDHFTIKQASSVLEKPSHPKTKRLLFSTCFFFESVKEKPRP